MENLRLVRTNRYYTQNITIESKKASSSGIGGEEQKELASVSEENLVYINNKSKFDSDFYIKWKHQIYTKWIMHFKGKENQDATSFMTTFENLTIQHVNKAAKVIKLMVDQQESKLFAWHMRDELIDLKFMSGDVIEMWKNNSISELSKMKETVKSFFNLTELNKYLKETVKIDF